MRPRLLRLPISHFCKKVEWAMTDHGITVDATNIWFRDLADIRAINPENTVPVLELGDRLICGSGAIMEWLAGESPEGQTLYPSEEAADWEAWADEFLGHFAQRDAYRVLYDTPTKYGRNPLLWLAAVPLHGLFLNILKAYKARRHYDQDDAERSDRLTRVADQLRANGPFLFGERKTAADYATAALMAPLLRIRTTEYLQHPDLPMLKSYVRRVKPRGSPIRDRERFTPGVRSRLEAKA